MKPRGNPSSRPAEPAPQPRRARRAMLAGAAALAAAGAAGVAFLAARGGGALVPGVSRARPVISNATVPSQAEVVVIGGGNIGCLAALTLAERGVKVVLCEKGVIAGEASGRSLGYVEGQLLDPVKMEIISRSKALWAGMNQRIQAETGYRRSGIVTAFLGREGLELGEGWLASVHGMPGVDARMLTAQETLQFTAGRPDAFVGGLYQPSDGCAEPKLAAPAIAEAVRRAGGTVLQQCAVRGLETTAGRVGGVVTERGAIACQAVVLAGGAWSPVLARSLGLELPQFMAFSGIARVSTGASAGPGVAVAIAEAGLAMRQTLDGHYDVCQLIGTTPITPAILRNLPRLKPAITHMWSQMRPVLDVGTFMAEWRIPRQWPLDQPSPFEANRILMPETRDRMLDGVVARFGDALPALQGARVAERWSGALTSTPDNMPVLSAVHGLPGLFIGSGFYYGLTMAPAAGEALADLVMGRPPAIDLSPYRHARFLDGSDIVFRF